MRKKLLSLLTPVLFFGFLAVFFVWALLKPDGAVSLSEGRALAQKPVNDLSDLPALIQKYSDYISDQFPLREEMLRLESAVQIRTKQHYARNVTVDDEGYLLPEVYRADPNERLAIVYALDQQVQTLPEVDFVYAVLPQKNNLLESDAADARRSEANRQALCDDLSQISSLTLLDIGTALTERYSAPERRAFYYRTDFHWNERGAFCAAEQIAAGMQEAGLLDGVTLPAEGDFEWQELGKTHTYLGDLNRRFSYQFSTQEEIPFYCLRDTADLRYYASGDAPAARSSILAGGLAAPELDYGALSTENLGYYRVSNPHARSDRRVLILKDSMENPMTDYFTALFSEVIVIDPRSYDEPYALAELVARYDLDSVLLLYHQNHISFELGQFLTK